MVLRMETMYLSMYMIPFMLCVCVCVCVCMEKQESRQRAYVDGVEIKGSYCTNAKEWIVTWNRAYVGCGLKNTDKREARYCGLTSLCAICQMMMEGNPSSILHFMYVYHYWRTRYLSTLFPYVLSLHSIFMNNVQSKLKTTYSSFDKGFFLRMSP